MLKRREKCDTYLTHVYRHLKERDLKILMMEGPSQKEKKRGKKKKKRERKGSTESIIEIPINLENRLYQEQ